ncbi:MAG: 4-hydroxy-tetrahydrodipicolinate synthase [Victivallaceae bacterium]|nr:4-hydroxy-tetrahydrodipicolinate synthase [Victivallaceae bacterium]
MEFRGVYTALVTPLSRGEVDYAKLRELVERQVKAKVAGIVPVGTTGESPTLTYEEHLKVVEVVAEQANGRCQIIAGTGANSTREAVEMTLKAKQCGVDATLQVVPYYNKPTQEGMYRHFMTVADSCGLPIVLYNIPGRCGVGLTVENVARLRQSSPLIEAVKEAAGSAERVSAMLDLCDITVLSGDDALTLPMLSVGGKGVVSVTSNLLPEKMVELVELFFAGKNEAAIALNKWLYPLFRDQFVETNPVPIKAAMAMCGIIEEEYRLPLCELTAPSREKLKATLSQLALI